MSSAPRFNPRGTLAIYRFEMARFKRTLWQSVATPVFDYGALFRCFRLGYRLQNR